MHLSSMHLQEEAVFVTQVFSTRALGLRPPNGVKIALAPSCECAAASLLASVAHLYDAAMDVSFWGRYRVAERTHPGLDQRFTALDSLPGRRPQEHGRALTEKISVELSGCRGHFRQNMPPITACASHPRRAARR